MASKLETLNLRLFLQHRREPAEVKEIVILLACLHVGLFACLPPPPAIVGTHISLLISIRQTLFLQHIWKLRYAYPNHHLPLGTVRTFGWEDGCRFQAIFARTEGTFGWVNQYLALMVASRSRWIISLFCFSFAKSSGVFPSL